MDKYTFGLMLLNLLGVGMKAEQVRARLEQARADGVSEDQVPKLLDQWYEEARQEALNAKPGDPDPTAVQLPLPPAASTDP